MQSKALRVISKQQMRHMAAYLSCLCRLSKRGRWLIGDTNSAANNLLIGYMIMLNEASDVCSIKID